MNMKEFLEKILRCNVEISKYKEKSKLPLLYVGNYHLFLVQIQGVEFLMAEPLQDMNLSALRKQQKQLEYLTGKSCVLALKNLNYYAKDKLLEEGIPFIWEGKQVYLPFLGVLLQNQTERNLQECRQISYLTQKLLLTAIYEKWQEINVTKAAERLNVTKTSITRAFDEIEILKIPYLSKKGRMRVFSCGENRKEMWNEIRIHLRNPLIQQFELRKDMQKVALLSGMSAVCYYSLLNDNEYRTYAVGKKDIGQLKIEKKDIVVSGERPECLVQELGYIIPFRDGKAIDPLSAALLISEDERQDERVEMAVDEMLEEYVWYEE